MIDQNMMNQLLKIATSEFRETITIVKDANIIIPGQPRVRLRTNPVNVTNGKKPSQSI